MCDGGYLEARTVVGTDLSKEGRIYHLFTKNRRQINCITIPKDTMKSSIKTLY